MPDVTLSESIYIQKVNNFGTALVDGTNYPASASFIDVTDYERFAFLIEMGTTTSAMTFQVQQATGASATPTNVSGATVSPVGTDDNLWFSIEVESARLTSGYRYVSVDCSGAAGADDYACITFLGYGARHLPVSQSASYSVATIVSG